MSDRNIIPCQSPEQEIGAGILPVAVEFVLFEVSRQATSLSQADVETIIADLRAAYQTGLLLAQRPKRIVKPHRFIKPVRFKSNRS